jgi:hypothetical protein
MEKIELMKVDYNTGAIERKINEIIEVINKMSEKPVKKIVKDKQ